MQGARRGKKRRRRACIEAGKDNGGDDVGAPGTVELPRENVTAWPRPSPTPSHAAARAHSLREAAARAEAQSEASFSEWWRQSHVICVCRRPLLITLEDFVPAKGWMRSGGGGVSLCKTHRCAPSPG